MGKILVSGLTNIETSLKVDSFPLYYCPIEYPFFGVSACVSGVGFNVAKALKTLGDEVDLLSEVGDDIYGKIIREEIAGLGIDAKNCLVYQGTSTASSVVLTDKEGKRKIYCDLKDIQDRAPLSESIVKLEDYSLVALTNINFNRELLLSAKKKGITIASDVHVISSADDPYNKLFMENADLLFLSNENIRGREMDFAKEIYQRYHNKVIVIGCGAEGAIMYLGEKNTTFRESAFAPYGVSSTVGAGDALFSSFIHFYNKGVGVWPSLARAVLFAGIKISKAGGANGFASEKEVLSFFD